MKIVIASDTYWPRINGASTSITRFTDYFVKEGNKVLLIIPAYKKLDVPYEIVDKDNLKICRVSSRSSFFSIEDHLFLKKSFNLIFKVLDDFNADIYHIQTEFAARKLILKYCKSRNIQNLCATSHTMWEKYFDQYLPHVPNFLEHTFVKVQMKYRYKALVNVIMPSQINKDIFLKYNIKKNKYTIIPTGIENNFNLYDKYKLLEIKKHLTKKYPIIEDKKILLFVGRLAKEKNIDFLLDSFEKLFENNKDIVLLLVGGGPDKDELIEHSNRLQSKDSIIFLNYINYEDMKYYYLLSHVFVFPSKTETQGLVILEAMSCNKPVVAIGEGGVLYTITNDYGGYLVKEDINEFNSKVNLLLNDDNLYENKSKEAYNYIDDWKMDKIGKKMLDYYSKIINKN